MSAIHTLGGQERIKSKKLIDTLFNGGNSRSLTAFPLRIVYMIRARESDDNSQAQIMVSVSKRHFKRAVKRNRIKRQIRETYRQNKELLLDVLIQKPETTVCMAFIWQSDQLFPSSDIEHCMKSLLQRVAEKL
ncbi:MAG: ribonuclease P protein component [Prevotella sp.]|jgi:ribonuclease P protein component|nr:ribonuclease P protein component [Prevotella sp.]MBQ2192845.1 ribonuclease P protein component [Prevotella sp.]